MILFNQLKIYIYQFFKLKPDNNYESGKRSNYWKKNIQSTYQKL
jgi:hypothetical protein